MAERRMFAKTIIDSDAFLDMPLSTQSLYFHLSMRADDDGFINNPKKIQRMIGASEDDLKLLITKKFLIPFDSGVVVIKHWKIHNYIRNDRYKETVYQEEKALLSVKDNHSYTLGIPDVNQDGYQMDTQVRLGKDSIGKDSINKNIKHHHGEHNNVLLTDEEYQKLMDKFPNDYQKRIDDLSWGIATKGYSYKSHYMAILSWSRKEERRKDGKTEPVRVSKFSGIGTTY